MKGSTQTPTHATLTEYVNESDDIEAVDGGPVANTYTIQNVSFGPHETKSWSLAEQERLDYHVNEHRIECECGETFDDWDEAKANVALS